MNPAVPALSFSSRIEHSLGEKLASIYKQYRVDYQRWFSHARGNISSEVRREKINQFMPELLSTYDSLCHALGGDEQTCAFLSLYNPPAFMSGCSQAARARDVVELVRNYDYPSRFSDRMLLHTEWNKTKVICMTDCLWGATDGMNEHGLAVSLAYGGRAKKADGFSITLVLRYILEFCECTADAVEVLKKIPVHMSYNITIVDKMGDISTVLICPGSKPVVTSLAFATNHQPGGEITHLDSLADSYHRQEYLSTKLSNSRNNKYSMVQMFLRPPLLRQASQWKNWGTLYTARYRPRGGLVDLHWPQGQVLIQSFDQFHESDIQVASAAYL